ncbi:MAG: hypothetical protein ABIP24_01075 [Croceibacterium sp.]
MQIIYVGIGQALTPEGYYRSGNVLQRLFASLRGYYNGIAVI